MRAAEFAISEKKRPKRRPRWAAYGPGPYGGYGYYAGYSGDSGGGDGGGVGEDQDLKELNIAATLRFIKDAHGDQLYGKLPYWRHPRAVAVTGRKIFGSKFNSEAVKTAFLHDVVEDTHVGLDELKKLGFSDQVIDAVSLLTKDKSLNYSDNIQRILRSGNTLAMMVKYADNYENYTGDKSDWTSDRASASNQKYLKSLNMLGDILGVNHHLGEASYEGNIGMMEVSKFFKIANAAQKKLFKELLEKGKRGLAWKLIQDVTDTRLQGREFEIGEDRTADVVFDTGEKKRVRYQPTNKDIVDTIIKYYLKQGLKVVKVDDEEIAWDGTNEGWRDTLAGLALGAGVAMGGAAEANIEKVSVSKGDTVYSIAKAFDTTPDIIKKLNKLDRNFTIKPGDTLKVPTGEIIDEPSKEKKPEAEKTDKKEIEISKAELEDSITGRPLEVYFRKFLESQSIKGEELTAIMAQSDVETDHFRTLKEYGGKNYFKMYEPVFRKDKKTGKIIVDPETKKFKHFNDLADRLGNDYRGDGARYKGRGFLQVTGRYNYRVIGQDIGVDLEKNPEILEKDKEIAARASLAYWKRFSKPKIKNFKDVKGVTGTINPGLKHLEKRKERHKEYKVAMQ